MQIRRRLRRLGVKVAVMAVAVPLVAAALPYSGATGQVPGALRVLGQLPAVKGPLRDANSQDKIAALDAAGRRMFMVFQSMDGGGYMVTYDLRSRIPKQVRLGYLGKASEFFVTNTYTATFDNKRGNVALISGSAYIQGQGLEGDTGNITVYNDLQQKVVARWFLGQKIPGFYPFGITYDKAADRYLLAGDFSEQRFIADGTPVVGSKAAGPVSAIVALDATTGDVQWVRALPDCQQILYSKGIGSLIARSEHLDAVYVTCVSGGTAAATTYPGEAGVVRLHVAKTGTSADAARWSYDFFPISGSYFAGGTGSGIAAFDAKAERFYVQSISFKTPGAFVLDGRLSAWAGFISSPVPVNYFAGLNSGLGHYYMGIASGDGKGVFDGTLVADARQTPVPAGSLAPIVTSANIVADPLSRRLFVRPGPATKAKEPYLVVEDLMPVSHDVADDSYDDDTTNTADTPAAEIFYGIGATGYGAQTIQVGGGSSPVTILGQHSESLPKVADDTRAIMTSRAGAIDLRPGGAAASGQAALADTSTITEYETQRGPNSWPYKVASCLDSGGQPVHQTLSDTDQVSGSAADDEVTVTCDLAKNATSVKVRMGSGGNGAAKVGGSSYDAAATRDRRNGGSVTSNAIARNVTLDVGGAGLVTIGRIAATSVAKAHGRPGTATSMWARTVSGVHVTDAAGKVLLDAPGCTTTITAAAGKVTTKDTCAPYAATINALFPSRLKVDFPMPRVSATPKGAFAGVEQSVAQFLNNVTVNDQGVIYFGDSLGLRPAPAMVTETYNDTTERSRTVTALAATQTYTIFTVAPAYRYPNVPVDDNGGGTDQQGNGGNPGGGTVPVIKPGGPTAPQHNDGGVPLPRTPQLVAAPQTGLAGFLLMHRSLRDAVLIVLLAGLVLSGAGTAWRRRRLVEVLVTVPGKEVAQ